LEDALKLIKATEKSARKVAKALRELGEQVGGAELIADQIRGGELVIGELGSSINFIDAGTLSTDNDNL
jgi:hypothetical protein